MSIDLERRCLHVLVAMPWAATLSVIISVGGWMQFISSRVYRSGSNALPPMNKLAYSVSAADDTTVGTSVLSTADKVWVVCTTTADECTGS